MSKIFLNCKKITAASLISLLVINAQAMADTFQVTTYEELEQAVGSVNSGDTIDIEEPITLTGNISFPTDKNFTIHGVGSGSITTKRYSFNYSPNVAIYDLKINKITTYANNSRNGADGGAIYNSLGETLQ